MSYIKAELISVLFLTILDIFIFVTSRSFPPKPQLFVNVLIVLFTVLIVAYFIQIVAKYKKLQRNSEEVDSKIEIGNAKVVIATILFALYIFLFVHIVGFWLATIIFTVISLYVLGLKKFRMLIIFTVFFVLVLYFSFDYLLGIPLPEGMIF